MKFIVSVKQVPARDSSLKVSSGGKWLDESDITYEMNEPDAYALEEALQLKEKLGGEVVVLCAGPQRASQTIREALAKGRRSRNPCGAGRDRHLDALATARLLAKAVEPEKADLILPDCNPMISATARPESFSPNFWAMRTPPS